MRQEVGVRGPTTQYRSSSEFNSLSHAHQLESGTQRRDSKSGEFSKRGKAESGSQKMSYQ